jgi:hypothetical protein
MSVFDWFKRTPTEADFARHLLAVAKNAGESGWTYDAAGSTLRNGPQAINLGNLYLEYAQASGAQRSQYSEKYRQILKMSRGDGVPKLWTLAQTRLFPLLRSRYEILSLEIATRGAAAPRLPRATQRFHPLLDIVLGYDHGQTITQIAADKIAEWGVSLEAAIERARANLRALPSPTWTRITQGVWKLESREGYTESFLQLPKVFERLPAKGAPLAMIPNRGVLLATGFEEPGGTAALIGAAIKSLQEAPWPLSGDLFHMTPGGAEPYTPTGADGDHLATAQKIDRASIYGAQRDALNKLHESTKTDRFVASYKLTAPQSNPTVASSWCTWTEGVDALLPVTDRVIFVRDPTGTKQLLQVPWADVERVVGHYFQATPEDPPRVRVNQFPTPAEWDELGRHKL